MSSTLHLYANSCTAFLLAILAKRFCSKPLDLQAQQWSPHQPHRCCRDAPSLSSVGSILPLPGPQHKTGAARATRPASSFPQGHPDTLKVVHTQEAHSTLPFLLLWGTPPQDWEEAGLCTTKESPSLSLQQTWVFVCHVMQFSFLPNGVH